MGEPEEGMAKKSEAAPVTFQKKEEEKELTPKEIKEEWEALKKRVAYLESELAKKDALLKESDEQLVRIIKKNKNFLDEKSIFDRIKYEKFLIENNINPSEFEKRLKNRELEKKLFFLLNGGINSPEFMVKKYYKYENSKIDLRFINLDNSH